VRRILGVMAAAGLMFGLTACLTSTGGGAATGAVAGAVVAGPVGAVVGAGTGAVVGTANSDHHH
jgi:hypothetical protein